MKLVSGSMIDELKARVKVESGRAPAAETFYAPFSSLTGRHECSAAQAPVQSVDIHLF